MENIIGHENEINILDKMIIENKVAHAYLFSGKEGIGKKLVATYFAKRINNTDDENGINIIEPDGDMIKIEVVRSLINEVYLRPTDSNKKIFIINNADKMNPNAQNALLKVLEEPPLYAVIILITSKKEKIIKTILSRVTEIKFGNLSNEQIKKIIGKDVDFEFARGSAKRALELSENKSITIAKELALLLESKNFIDINKKISEIKSGDASIIEVLEFIKIMYSNDIKNDTNKKINIINLIDETIKSLNRNANEDLTLDKFIINVCNMNL